MGLPRIAERLRGRPFAVKTGALQRRSRLMGQNICHAAPAISAACCKALAKAGYTRSPMTTSSMASEAVRWGPSSRPISAIARVLRYLARYEIAAIMHFAAFAYVGESMRQAAALFQQNTLKTLACSMPCSPPAPHIVSPRPARPTARRAHAITEDTRSARSILMREQADGGAALHWTGAYGIDYAAPALFQRRRAIRREIGEEHEPRRISFRSSSRAPAPQARSTARLPDAGRTAIRDYIHVQDLARHSRDRHFCRKGASSSISAPAPSQRARGRRAPSA